MFTLVWVVLAIGVPAILTGVAWAHTGPSTPSPLIAAAMWTPLYAGFLWFLHEAHNDAMAIAASEGRTDVALTRYIPGFVVGTAVFVLGLVGIFLSIGR
jgi:hypothetical protein